MDHAYAQNLAKPPFVRICPKFTIYALYPESFCDKNLAIWKVFAFCDSGLGKTWSAIFFDKCEFEVYVSFLRYQNFILTIEILRNLSNALLDVLSFCKSFNFTFVILLG